MPLFKNKYFVFSLIFFSLSLLGFFYLINQKQSNQKTSSVSLAPSPSPSSYPSPTLAPSTPSSASLIGTHQPTLTSRPTLTPPTSSQTNQSPGPTRIILPVVGFDFPSKALTLVGSIITLFGFLLIF